MKKARYTHAINFLWVGNNMFEITGLVGKLEFLYILVRQKLLCHEMVHVSRNMLVDFVCDRGSQKHCSSVQISENVN